MTDRTAQDIIRDLQKPRARKNHFLCQEAASLLAINESGIVAVSQQNDRLAGVVKEMTFVLGATMDAILHHWGPEGADKVRRHLVLARKSLDTNAEIDELEKVLAGESAGT